MFWTLNSVKYTLTFKERTSISDIKTYGKIRKIRKIATGRGNGTTTGFLLEYAYYKTIAIDLNKRQTLDINPKAMH